MIRKKQAALLAAAVLALTGMTAQAAPLSDAKTRPATPQTLLDDPGLKSDLALVLDQTNESVLYARRADVPTPIASITKLMTALVVLEANQPLDELIEITPIDAFNGKGTYSRLAPGTRLTRGELLRLALMASENRAAHALGNAYPGGMPAFVKAMNRKAKALGMTKSRFVEPTGLSSENVATPRDLVKLVVAAAENPIIREYSTSPEYTVVVGKQLMTFHNTNLLVKNPEWNIAVQKTGYISAAGRCLVMQADIQGRHIVMVLLRSVGKYTRTADAKRIKKWLEAKAAQAVSEVVASSSGS
jgi:D-alanyl-D-alanine endopeptidase (penicillin-binding protein 7)